MMKSAAGFGFALAMALSFGRVEGQSGTIVYNWVAALDVAWFASEPHVLQQAFVGEDGSGVAVMGSLYDGVHHVDRGTAPVEWSITDEQREHLGYPLIVAVGEAGGEEVEAWFAPGIPVSAGPALYGGLPGMIRRECQGLRAVDP